MEIFLLISVLLLNGFFTAFLSGIAGSVSSEDLRRIFETNGSPNSRLELFKSRFDEQNNLFYAIEHIFYIVSSVLLGAIIYEMQVHWAYFVLSIIGIFLFALLMRTLLYALGRRLGKIYAKSLMTLLLVFATLSYPINKVLTNIIEKIRGKSTEEASIEELTALVETAREDGSLDPGEYHILKSIMHFREVYVSDVMTPRTVVFSCRAEDKIEEVLHLPELQMYSRIPLREGESLDDGIAGYIMTKDIFYSALNGKTNIKLRNIVREVYYIPENAELDDALEQFLKRRQHLFMVVDEYGGIEGLLTMEDVVETILGQEIVDEADKIVDLRELAAQRRDKRIAAIANSIVSTSNERNVQDE